VIILIFFLPNTAIGVRRMHDIGKSGWFYLIPIYNLILACTLGDEGSNMYGPDPKNPDTGDEIDQLGKPSNISEVKGQEHY